MSEAEELKKQLHEWRAVLLSDENLSHERYKRLMSDQSDEDTDECDIDELRVRWEEAKNPWSAEAELAGMFPNGYTDDDGPAF